MHIVVVKENVLLPIVVVKENVLMPIVVVKVCFIVYKS